MEEDIKLLEEWVKESKQFEKDFNFEKFFEGTKAHERILAIENLINKYKEQEKMIELMSKTMHYICLFSSQSKYVIGKYCKIYNSGNIGECEGLICSECVANYFRKKAKGG